MFGSKRRKERERIKGEAIKLMLDSINKALKDAQEINDIMDSRKVEDEFYRR